jgi:hypothetical protein
VKAKQKTTGDLIVFTPPLKKSSVQDEVFAKNASIHIERMSDESIFMSIITKNSAYGFYFTVGENDITNRNGEKIRPLNLKAHDMALTKEQREMNL